MRQAALFFDFDGTLAKPNTSFLSSLRGALEESGVSLPEDSCRDFLKAACSWYHPERSYEAAVKEAWWEDLLKKLQDFLGSSGVNGEKIPGILKAFRFLCVHYPYELYEDAREVLLDLKKLGIPCYLLSNNFPELKIRVRELGLGDCFQGIFLSSELGYEKPRKELFSLALAAAGDPDLPIMVGDNRIADIQGAAARGFYTIYVHGSDPCREADACCRDLRSIPQIVKQLCRGC